LRNSSAFRGVPEIVDLAEPYAEIEGVAFSAAVEGVMPHSFLTSA
jgi:hypothetical protein